MTPNEQPASKQDIIDLRQEMTALEGRLIETMRDMQSELLRGLERFSRGNFSRLHRLETSDNDLNDRITALEERVMALETRPPRP